MATSNKFAGRCNNPACPLGKNRYNGVAVGEGYITKINDKWVTWCKECVPVQKSAGEAERRVLTADGKIFTPYEPQNLPLIKSLKGPGGVFGPRWNKEGKFWEISLEQADRQRLLEVAERLRLEVAPQLREGNLVTEQAQNATHAGLYPFQVVGVNWMAKRKKALLADEMGLGKTIQALISIPAHGKALVVCPATLKLNWRNEASVWRPDLKVVVLKGGDSFRFPQAGEIVITNYDILADYLDPTPKVKGARKAPKITWEALKAWRVKLKEQHPEAEGTTVIFDEAHKVKNYKTERSRKVRELSRLSSSVWGLTGTPLDNEPSDLYGVLDSLDMAFDVFTPRKGQSSFRRFQELFAVSEDRWGACRYGTPDPMVPELLRRVMLRRTRGEVMPDLPTKTYTNLIVGDMPERIRQQLDEMWESDGTALEVDGSLPPFERFSEIRAALAKSNIPAMLEYIEEQEEQGVPLVVFSSHLAPLDELLGRPGWAVISGDTKLEKRQEIVDAFQAGHLKGIALTIRAGGVGLTLTHAWKVLFVDLDWVPGWNSQAEDRVCRIGQTSNKVEIVRMVNDHPLTLHILNILAEKTRLIENAVIKTMPVAVSAPVTPSKETETEEQYQARMARIQQAQEELEKAKAESDASQAKAKAKSKVDLIHSREKGRNQRPILPLTDKRVAVVREAFKFMLSVCDGAHQRDAQGFNKPDAVIAHYLLTAGLETPKEVEAAYYMLVRYHRQLSKSYPLLFNGSPEDRAAIIAEAQAGEDSIYSMDPDRHTI
jgi:superfamily II DNA or RNA helicase